MQYQETNKHQSSEINIGPQSFHRKKVMTRIGTSDSLPDSIEIIFLEIQYI